MLPEELIHGLARGTERLPGHCPALPGEFKAQDEVRCRQLARAMIGPLDQADHGTRKRLGEPDLLQFVRIAQAAPQLRWGSTLSFLNVALLGSIFSVMLGGMGNDPFRRPETWILMAIVSLHAGRTSERSQR